MDQPTDPLSLVLADMPDVVEALLRDHVADEGGQCRACGTPGTGTHHIDSPCSLQRIAETAQSLRTDAARRAR